MKTDYVLKHIGENYSMVVCTFPSERLAEKAMEYYAKYVVWNWKTKVVYNTTWRIDFDNLHSIIVSKEQRALSMKDFKRMLCFNEEEK